MDYKGRINLLVAFFRFYVIKNKKKNKKKKRKVYTCLKFNIKICSYLWRSIAAENMQ